MSTTDPMIGQQFDGYRIDRLLGKGSMGMVYLGSDVRTGSQVAVKTMTTEAANDEEMLQRFEREARLASELIHPNVAHVYTTGSFREMPYLVMEYVDGTTLGDMVDSQGPMPYERALECMRQSAMGLKAASENGSVHRDIKPGNIMITRAGEAKILDFGIARNHGGDSLRTAVGVVLGSPYYMSPEQSAARNLDHRSDQYSLGATFYFLLTGKPPFQGRNLIEIVKKRAANDLAPIESLNRKVPRHVAEICYKMMKPSPGDRYQSYNELIAAIEAVQKGKRPEPADSRPLAGAGSDISTMVISREEALAHAQAHVEMNKKEDRKAAREAAGQDESFLERPAVRFAMFGLAGLLVAAALYILIFQK